MAKADKKQRHKSKRQAKQHNLRRRGALSPLTRLARAPGEVEYWMSDGFESLGQMQLFAYKRTAEGGGVACFLVDRGVVGLKDAFIHMNVDRKLFEQMRHAGRDSGITMHRTTLEELRGWVAGGLRWAYENGMRLPQNWVKTASLIGGVGDWQSADVSAFRKEFSGHPLDLRQRLISEPFDAYIQRKDVEFLFADAPYMDQNTGNYLNNPIPELSQAEQFLQDIPEDHLSLMEDQITPTVEALVTKSSEWLTGRGISPSPELARAWQNLTLATLLGHIATADGMVEDLADIAPQLLDVLGSDIEEEHFEVYAHAVSQAFEFMQENPTILESLMSGGDPTPAD